MNKVLERYPIGTMIAFLPLWIALYFAIQSIADAIVSLAGLPPGEHMTEAVRFFVFETPKVLLLLTVVVFGVGIVRTVFFSRTHAKDPRREVALCRERAGEHARHRNPVLLVFGNSALYRLRGGWRPARGHVFVSRCRSDDQRNCGCPLVRPLRLGNGASRMSAPAC